MGFFLEFITNKILLSVVFAYFFAGLLKLIFVFIAYDRIDFMVFFRTGGMPSSHTASVTAMTTAVYLSSGVSDLFIISSIVSTIVISDAVGLRRAVGKQAEVLNQMTDEFRYFRRIKTKKLYELLGHTPKQTIAGFILGILVARLVFVFF
ncbi:MAG: divergent PAP2 family protein [archaeon]